MTNTKTNSAIGICVFVTHIYVCSSTQIRYLFTLFQERKRICLNTVFHFLFGKVFFFSVATFIFSSSFLSFAFFFKYAINTSPMRKKAKHSVTFKVPAYDPIESLVDIYIYIHSFCFLTFFSLFFYTFHFYFTFLNCLKEKTSILHPFTV